MYRYDLFRAIEWSVVDLGEGAGKLLWVQGLGQGSGTSPNHP